MATEISSGSYTREQIELLKRTVASGTTDDEFALFLATAQRLGLSPFARQIFAVRRYSREAGGYVMAIQVSIDGFRSIASRTGEATGQEGPYWCGPDGVWRDIWLDDKPPAAAKVVVLRRGHPYVGVATMRSYCQRKKDGSPMAMWGSMPDTMIAKCFDSRTEVLTTLGFEPFASAKGRVLQVTPAGLVPVDARPFAQAYDGPMVTLDSDDLNFSVTPNHDMVTTAGKVEAGVMYEMARARARHWIPRIPAGRVDDLPGVLDDDIVLAAALVTDGYFSSGASFKIAVSRQKKIDLLATLSPTTTTIVRCAGAEGQADCGRVIVTRKDKVAFLFPRSRTSWLVGDGKEIMVDRLLELSCRQARIFVDAMLFFDGNKVAKTGVRRLYTSRLDHAAAFEVAAVAAGYAVSPRRGRVSDLSTKPNFAIGVSDRNEIPVRRWGRDYKGKGGNETGRTGMEITPNAGGEVWCVTVPSGAIVVRRDGFSMVCGNCAESLALRKAFPAELSGVYSPEEMAQASNDHDEPPARVVDVLDRAPARPATKALPAEVVADEAVVADLVFALRDAGTVDELKSIGRQIAALPKSVADALRAPYAARLAEIKGRA